MTGRKLVGLGLACLVTCWIISGCREESARPRQATRGGDPPAEARNIAGTPDSTTVEGRQPGTDVASPKDAEPRTHDSRTDASAVRVVLTSDSGVAGEPFYSMIAALLITDPAGRRTGFDASTAQIHNEIPWSSYYDDVIEDPTEDGAGAAWRIAEIMGPETGIYRIDVQGAGEGTYTLSIRGYDTRSKSSGREVRRIPIGRGAVHRYILEFDKTSASGLILRKSENGSRGR